MKNIILRVHIYREGRQRERERGERKKETDKERKTLKKDTEIYINFH